MALTKKNIDAIKVTLQPEFDKLDQNAKGHRDEILTAVDAYKKLVEKYELELTSLQGKYTLGR